MDMKKLKGFASAQLPPQEIGGDFQNFALCKSRFSLDIEAVTFS
jgi:hypothetical protein